MILYGDSWIIQGDGNSISSEQSTRIGLYCILFSLALIILMYVFRDELKKRKKLDFGIRLGLSIVSVLYVTIPMIYSEIRLDYVDPIRWPLHLCSISSISISIFFFTKFKKIHVYLFFPGLMGAIFGLLFPGAFYRGLDIMVYNYYIGHINIFLAFMYMILIHESKLNPKDILISIPVLGVFVLAVILPINLKYDTFFFFIGPRAIQQQSLLGLFGEWPGMLLPFMIFAAFVIALCALCTYYTGILYRKYLERKGEK